MEDSFIETSSLNDEIHRLMSLLLTQHIRSWYSKVTLDEELFAQFHDLFDHIQVTLAARIQAQDWDDFVMHQLPHILLRHLEDFNIAKDRVRSNLGLEDSFLKLQSHRGIKDQDTYMMDLADALLIVLLPDSELSSDLAYGFTREFLSDLVIKTLVERISEPWFWDELTLRMQDVIEAFDWRTTTRRMINDFMIAPRWKIRSQSLNSPTTTASIVLQVRRSVLHSLDLFLAHIYQDRSDDRSSLYDTAFPGILRQLFRASKSTFFHQVINDVLVPFADLICGEQLVASIRARWSAASRQRSISRMVKLVRLILFPNDEPSPNRVIPTEAEQARNRAEVHARLPQVLQNDFTQSKLINKILIFNIFDTILGTIFPELQRRTAEQLKEKVIKIRQANLEATGDGGIHTVKPANNEELFLPQYHDLNSYTQTSSISNTTAENDIGASTPSTGLESMQAMKRSFEVKRRTVSGS